MSLSALQSLTMEILIFLVCTCFLLPVQPKETDRHTYCESCLTVAQEIEKALKQAPDENRQTVVENLINGGVCKKVSSFKNDHKTNNNLVSSCIHLLDSRYDQFRAALVNKEPKNLGIVLCYEESPACVGVKRQSFGDSRGIFRESDIDALLEKNKENMRIVQPIRQDLPTHTRDEL